MSVESWIVIFVLGLLVLVVLVAIGIYNRLVRSSVQTKEAWSGIDVQLRRRESLIPNLVETVKGYASHERVVFKEVTQARSALHDASGPAESTAANQVLTAALGKLFAVVENYPELKASNNFQDLQDELSDVEEKIAYARQFYNRNAASFNIQIRSIPDILIARMLRFERYEFFEEGEKTRDDVQVSFAPASTTGKVREPQQEG
jgi:LemA protein